jgi:hypothetical protein
MLLDQVRYGHTVLLLFRPTAAPLHSIMILSMFRLMARPCIPNISPPSVWFLLVPVSLMNKRKFGPHQSVAVSSNEKKSPGQPSSCGAVICGDTRNSRFRAKASSSPSSYYILQDYTLHLQLASCYDVTHFPTWELHWGLRVNTWVDLPVPPWRLLSSFIVERLSSATRHFICPMMLPTMTAASRSQPPGALVPLLNDAFGN